MEHKPNISFVCISKKDAIDGAFNCDCIICNKTHDGSRILETNCGHNICVYCLKLLLAKNANAQLNCPSCKKEIKMLYMFYSCINANCASEAKEKRYVKEIVCFCKIRNSSKRKKCNENEYIY